MIRKLSVIIGLTIGIVCASLHAPAQTLYRLPSASAGNTIELEVANPSGMALTGVVASVASAPSWIKFTNTEQKLSMIKAKQEEKALFTFSVDKNAPVNEEQIITFAIRSNSARIWKKEFRIVVDPPDHFELFQNYPNPFNPTTTISYQIPSPSHVKIIVFNMLGQSVATIVDQNKDAGSYEEIFDGRNYGSGVYVYRLTVTGPNGLHHQSQKTMILLK